MRNGTRPLAGERLPIASGLLYLAQIRVSLSVFRRILLFVRRQLTLIRSVFLSEISQQFIPSVPTSVGYIRTLAIHLAV